ncbi:MAG: hypothetical protein U1F36_21615 [Planctomycetota bacterium]
MRAAKLSVLLAIACSGIARAQAATSPRGLDSLEGDSSHFALFNPGYARFQQIDDTWRGHAATLRSLAFRRDFDRTSPFGGPRTLDLTVRLGEADYATASGTFATNWSATPTVAFARRSVNTPDWSQLPTSRPMPFQLVFPLDAPFSYTGTLALGFELAMENVTSFGSPDVDAERGTTSALNRAIGIASGFGCLAPGQPIEMSHTLTLENYGPSHAGYGMRIGVACRNAVPTQGVVLNVDFTPQSLTVPGLCGTLRVLPTFGFAVGTSDAGGDLAQTWITLPHLRGLEGLRLFTQALCLAPNLPGIPVVVSEQRDARMPEAPRLPPACGYVYSTSLAAPGDTLWRDRGVVVRFGT